MLIRDKITGTIYEIYGTAIDKNGDVCFVVWEPRTNSFEKRLSNCFMTVLKEPKKVSEIRSSNMPTKPPKCVNERNRTNTYVSCACRDVPISPANCNIYCRSYKTL